MKPNFPTGPEPGDVIEGRYVVRECIGQGGMSSVYLADQPALQRQVAIKVLHPELVGISQLSRRIHQEAVLACKVRDPHVVVVLDWGTLPDGASYLVMEHVAGRPLGRILADEPVPMARVVDLFGQVLAALAATHRSGVVHSDIKTDNFLVTAVDGADHVTLIDFGLAQVMGAARCDDGEGAEALISGTPEYMAPEVIAGDPPSAASDLYGAGIVLYELLTGATPFGGGTAMDIMIRQTREAFVPPSQRRPDRGIPAALDRVVLRALDKRPEARFCDAATFARELRAAVAGTAGPGEPAADGAPLPVSAVAAAALPPRHRLARGSDCSELWPITPLEPARRAIAEAVHRGDVAAIADGYLALASDLAEHHQPARAIRELQDALDRVTAAGAAASGDAAAAVDRIVVALAALYDRTGDRRLARWVVSGVDPRPTWTFAIERRAERA